MLFSFLLYSKVIPFLYYKITYVLYILCTRIYTHTHIQHPVMNRNGEDSEKVSSQDTECSSLCLQLFIHNRRLRVTWTSEPTCEESLGTTGACGICSGASGSRPLVCGALGTTGDLPKRLVEFRPQGCSAAHRVSVSSGGRSCNPFSLLETPRMRLWRASQVE